MRARSMIPLLVACGLALAGLCVSPARAHAAVACGAANAYHVMTCTVDPAIDAGALCNDGTTPAFWVRPGTGAGASKWVIWLEGGGHCIDTTSCEQRTDSVTGLRLLTARGFVGVRGQGVLSAAPKTNPTLHDANTVLVHYCSSDDWSGAYSPSSAFNANDPTTWYFQGRRIALAAVQSLSQLGLGFTNATVIVLGGSSAGGVGITVDANDILPLLPPAPTILLANDAGFAIDVGQFDPSAPAPYIYGAQPTAFDQNYATAIALWHGRGDARCAATATTTQQSVDCYNTSLLLQNNYIALPAFVAESQIDKAQASLELCPALFGHCPLPDSPATAAGQYVTAFGALMAGALTAGTYSVASPDAYAHEILADKDWFATPYALPGGGTTTAQAVWSQWLANPGVRIVSLGNAPGVAP